MTLFGKLIHAAPLAGALLLTACGGAGGVSSAGASSGGGQQIAVGEPNGKAIAVADFTAAVSGAACAGVRNDLYVIDNTHVLADRAGNCPDNAYAFTLYGATPAEVLCTQHDSIAGPRTDCKDAAARQLFDGLLKNLDKADLGLGGTHKVEKVRVNSVASGFEPLLLDGDSAIKAPRTVVIKSDAELARLLDEHNAGRIPAPLLAKVDFTTKMVVGVFLGEQGRGCRALSIVKVSAEGRQLEVDYEVHDLMTLQACTQAMSAPAALAVVDRTDGAVDFVSVSPEQLKFSTVDKSFQSSVPKAQNVVIRDAAALSALLGAGNTLPKVDFAKYMLVGAFLGQQPSGCFDVAVSSIERVGKGLQVTLAHTVPGPTVLCAAVMTAPMHLVQVERTDEPVEFRTLTVTL